jgi:aspartate/methionine/tyrosine aminotransferase
MGSIEFSKFLVTEAEVAVSPGVGFEPGERVTSES